MRRLIAQTFPAHGVIGEEYGAGSSRRGICLGARPDRRHEELHLRHADLGHSDRPHASRSPRLRHDGAAVHPGALLWRRQTREAADSGDARGDAPPSEWATRILRTRACASLSEATLMTTSPMLIRDDADREAYTRVEREARLPRYGGDCYAYCALAAGFVDLVIETNLKPHDIVALAPIIEGRRRDRHDLGRRGRGQRRAHPGCRRPRACMTRRAPAAGLSLTASAKGSNGAGRRRRPAARRDKAGQGARGEDRGRATDERTFEQVGCGRAGGSSTIAK